VAAGRREDLSGAMIAAWAAARGYRVAARAVVPDGAFGQQSRDREGEEDRKQ
jgi:molybdopterin biosynthesis enzyme MoaB